MVPQLPPQPSLHHELQPRDFHRAAEAYRVAFRSWYEQTEYARTTRAECKEWLEESLETAHFSGPPPTAVHEAAVRELGVRKRCLDRARKVVDLCQKGCKEAMCQLKTNAGSLPREIVDIVVGMAWLVEEMEAPSTYSATLQDRPQDVVEIEEA